MLALGFDPAHYFPPTASPWSGKPIIEEVEEDLETAEGAGYASAEGGDACGSVAEDDDIAEDPSAATPPATPGGFPLASPMRRDPRLHFSHRKGSFLHSPTAWAARSPNARPARTSFTLSEDVEEHIDAEPDTPHKVETPNKPFTPWRHPRASRVSFAKSLRESFGGDLGDSLADLGAILHAGDHVTTATEHYEEECDRLGVAPLGTMRSLLNSGLDKVRVPENLLSPGHGTSLARALRVMDFVTVLDVSGNLLGDRVIQELCEALMVPGSSACGVTAPLRTLKLDTSNLRGQSVPSLAALVRGSGLLYLSLANNPLLGNAVRPLVEALADELTLCSLDLTNIGMEDVTGHALAEALGQNIILRHLYLSENKLIRAWASLGKALCLNLTLEVLDVSHNSAAGTPGMASMLLHNESLHHLDLTLCRFEDRAVKKLASVLPASSSLKVLTVDPALGSKLMRAMASTGGCSICVKETRIGSAGSDFEQMFELKFQGDASAIKKGAIAHAEAAGASRAAGSADPGSAVDEEERDFHAAWNALTARAGGADPLAARRVLLHKDYDSDEWEDRCAMQIAALAEGLCKNTNKEDDAVGAMMVQRRIEAAVNAAMFTRRVILENELKRTTQRLSKDPSNTDLKWEYQFAQRDLAKFLESGSEVLERLGLVGVGGGFEGDRRAGGMVIDMMDTSSDRTICLRLVGKGANLVEPPPLEEMLPPKMERVLRRVMDVLPECNATIRQLRDMLRNRENEFERIHVHYRSLVDLGEANDHELESSFARPETLRNSRNHGLASPDGETISMRQAWHFAHNCGILGAKLSMARLNAIATVCRRSEDTVDEESLELDDAHRPQMRLDVWEFAELLVRLAATKHQHQRCVDELMAAVLEAYPREWRDEAGLELGRTEVQDVLAGWHIKLLKTFKFFVRDAADVKLQAQAGSSTAAGGRQKAADLNTFSIQQPTKAGANKENTGSAPGSRGAPNAAAAGRRTGLTLRGESKAYGNKAYDARSASARSAKVAVKVAAPRPRSRQAAGAAAGGVKPAAYEDTVTVSGRRKAAAKPSSIIGHTGALANVESDGMEATMPFNNVLTMFEVLSLFSPIMAPKNVAALAMQVTRHPRLVPTVHSNNSGCALTFHEWLELLVRVALAIRPKPVANQRPMSLAACTELFFKDQFFKEVNKIWRGRF